jgi:hypothetical protein
MRKLIWTLLLAVSALVVTFAAGSALQVVAEANASKAAEPYVVVVNDDTTWRRGTPPRESGPARAHRVGRARLPRRQGLGPIGGRSPCAS